MKTRFLIFFPVFLLAHLVASEEADSLPDRVEVKGGAVLTGALESVTETTLSLRTPYAGRLEVALVSVERVVTENELAKALPETIAVLSPQAPPPVPSPLTGATPPVAVKPPARKEAPPTGTGEVRPWSLEAGLNLTGKSGNVEKIDINVTIDATMKRAYDRLDLYGRYAYGTNRSRRTSDEIILGGRYTNFFIEDIGIFFREELERDNFEGVLFRSTTASGLTWRLRNELDLTIEARSGISYRYEDYVDDGYEDFPGMDFGVDINWKFAEWGRFKGTYSYIPSVDNFSDFIIEQDTGLNFPLSTSEFWKLRFGLATKYNNRPDQGRDKMDLQYYARLIASWN